MKREALRVEQLSVRQENEPLISDVTFTAYQGELLCISGYHHAGKSVLASALVGEQPLDGGRIVMPGNQNPRTHICYIGVNSSDAHFILLLFASFLTYLLRSQYTRYTFQIQEKIDYTQIM